MRTAVCSDRFPIPLMGPSLPRRLGFAPFAINIDISFVLPAFHMKLLLVPTSARQCCSSNADCKPSSPWLVSHCPVASLLHRVLHFLSINHIFTGLIQGHAELAFLGKVSDEWHVGDDWDWRSNKVSYTTQALAPCSREAREDQPFPADYRIRCEAAIQRTPGMQSETS